ncbi:hypothetical protein SAMN02745220_05016 [Desulfopila aestuarii DSM 18488]|uniref:Uncharacterized protein n=1 Tax=Desulfopila aestuarii DSM 18488 TaxID=1121416 RepID=A0A1M7YKT2_9BACT|nr:hypothetical protein SAMN02745220_05016 [Desulfopila aestuarii DSM 18488]
MPIRIDTKSALIKVFPEGKPYHFPKIAQEWSKLTEETTKESSKFKAQVRLLFVAATSSVDILS